MTDILITTTDAEDAAIAALGSVSEVDPVKPETPEDFVRRHVRHQLDFVLASFTTQDTAKVTALLAKVAPEDRAQIDAILAKYADSKVIDRRGVECEH